MNKSIREVYVDFRDSVLHGEVEVNADTSEFMNQLDSLLGVHGGCSHQELHSA